MLVILLLLNFIAVLTLLFLKDHKWLVRLFSIVMCTMLFIALHEKTYYLSCALLFEIFYIQKISTVLLANEKPLEEKNKKEKTSLIPITILSIFTAMISGYLIITKDSYVEVVSMNLNFDNSEIYKMISILIIFLLIFVNTKEAE